MNSVSGYIRKFLNSDFEKTMKGGLKIRKKVNDEIWEKVESRIWPLTSMIRNDLYFFKTYE